MTATGKFLAQDCYVSVDGHDISNYCFNVDTPSTREEVDVSGFNASGNKETLAGQKDDTITLGILQSFITGGPHDILVDIFQNQTIVVVEIRPTSSAVSATNPRLYGNGQLFQYDGLNAQKGQRAEIQATFKAADSGGFTWANS